MTAVPPFTAEEILKVKAAAEEVLRATRPGILLRIRAMEVAGPVFGKPHSRHLELEPVGQNISAELLLEELHSQERAGSTDPHGGNWGADLMNGRYAVYSATLDALVETAAVTRKAFGGAENAIEFLVESQIANPKITREKVIGLLTIAAVRLAEGDNGVESEEASELTAEGFRQMTDRDVVKRIGEVMTDLRSQHAAMPNHPNALNAAAVARIAGILGSRE